MDLNLVAQDLFDELKSRYSHLTLGDDQAMTTVDPESARFFKFDWNNNPVSIAIDEDNLRLVYNKDLADSLEEEDQQSWYDFARAMREFAVTHNLGFKPQDVEKLDLEQGDFEFLSQVNTVQESTMHGTSKTSYRPLEKTKMIIRHSKSVDESIPGARSRNIQAIFIENNQGERFKFPYNYLNGARAMQMHVAKGGNPYDAIGEAIVSRVEEIATMRKFTQYAQRNGMIDESTQSYIDAAHLKIHDAKKLLNKVQSQTTYESAVEELANTVEENTQDTIDNLVKTFTKETFDESLVDAFKILPVMELKPSDDEEGSMGRQDIMKQASTATRYAQYVDNWLQDPESKLILKKDDSYDALQNNLRSQQKDTDLKLMTILRDIATRFISADQEDDAIVNFASDMETQLSQAGELFAKPNPEIKKLRGTAIKLANKYLQDMKRIKQDDAYKDEVRKSPEDIKAYKNIKGQTVDKGKLGKFYKRKYQGETAELEQWMDARIAEMHNTLDPDNIEASEYQDAFQEANNLEDRAEKMVLAKLKREYKGYESMVANARGRDDKRMYKDRLRDLGQMIKYVQGKTPFGIDTILEEEVAEMIEKAMAKLKGKGVKEDEGSDKEKWLRYAKFWKYIRDIMAQEADADIADGFISADNIDEEPSYVTAKEMMQTAMAKQNTPWNDSIIDSDLREYKHQISDNDNYTEDTNFGKMKKAAIEMITTGKTQIVPYRGYPPMDQMDYSAEDTTDEDIDNIIRLSGIK